MENHVAIIALKIPMANLFPSSTTVRPMGEYWSTASNTTVNVTIQPGFMNTVIFPDTGKAQEYRHLIKGLDKPKCTKVMYNKLGLLFHEIWFIEGTYNCFFIHCYEFPQYRKFYY